MDIRKTRIRKKKKARLMAAIGGGTVAAVALITAFVYLQIGRQYKKVFFPNTTINGMDVSKKSVEEVEKMLASGIDGYTLTIKEREGRTEVIKGSDVGLKLVLDGSLKDLLNKQDPLKWLKQEKEPKSYEMQTMIQYDQDKFSDFVTGLKCFQEDQMKKPENAYLSDYESGQGYHIVSAKEGNVLIPEKGKEIIADAVVSLKPEISIEEAYKNPQISNDNPQLVKQMQTLNTYTNAAITYTFGKEKEVLNGDMISNWVGIGEDGKAYVNGSKVNEYVNELATKYDTYNKAKLLNTSYGKTVKITGGSYGWRINRDQEALELTELIRTGQKKEREPIYIQKGASYGNTDYGNTYVEVNLTAQHLYVYKDGKRFLESDFVSGNPSKGWSTPTGVYSLTYKQRNAVLKGDNYSTKVSYWMPFNGNIGFHDAKWRSVFGGTIYKNNGSHGCINLPPAFAKLLFQNIDTGIPVLCYQLAGTEAQEDTTTTSTTTRSTTAAPTTAAITTVAQTTEASTTEKATTAAPTTTVAPTTTAVPTTEETTSTPDSVSGASRRAEDSEVGPGVVN